MKSLARLEVAHRSARWPHAWPDVPSKLQAYVGKYFFSIHVLFSYLQEEMILNCVRVPQPTLYVRLFPLMLFKNKQKQNQKKKTTKQETKPHTIHTYLVTSTTPVRVTELPPALFHDKSWFLNQTYRVWSIFFCTIVFGRIWSGENIMNCNLLHEKEIYVK